MRKYREQPLTQNYIDIIADELKTIILNAAREEYKEVPRAPTAKVNFHKDIAGHIKATIEWEEATKTIPAEGYINSKGYMQ